MDGWIGRWMDGLICKVSPALWLWWIVSTLSHVCPLVQLSLSCARSAVLFSCGNCLRLKALIQSTDCAVHCCPIHYGYCWYQNYCILNTVPRVGGIVHATLFRIVHSHCPLASLKTEISIIFSLIVQCKKLFKSVQWIVDDLYTSLPHCRLAVRLLIVSWSAKMWCHHSQSSWICRSSSSRPSVRLPCRQHGASCSLCSQLAGSHCQTWSWPRLHGQDDQCCA